MFTRVHGWRSIRAIAALCGAAVACGGGGGDAHDDTGAITGVTLAQAFSGRTFSSPVKLLQHPSNDHRWYVVEQTGAIKTFLDTDAAPATTAATVGTPASLGNGEQGLLGMAFDPLFGISGEIYVSYTDASDESLVLQRWVSGNNGSTFSASTIILRIAHPGQTNHNGSDLAFGPGNLLFYSTGDGGGGGDPNRNAQNRNVLLGKILRLDVNATPPAGKTYAIPLGNPSAGNAQCNAGPTGSACPEVFARGFRNPWRMAFDPDTSKLYVGDVGQEQQEEIDIVTNGGNFGWNCFEGELAFNNVPACSTETFVAPEVVYNDDPTGPDAVTGGVVYRGTALPGLVGFYVYTDFYRGPFLAFDADVPNAPPQTLSASETHISAFGQGRDGEVYAVDLDGKIWKLVPSSG
jgi:glucose/arabinose dehydrogenase